MVYDTPDNVVELLDGVVHAARGTRFYHSILLKERNITSLGVFRDLPITPISKLRCQSLIDVITNPDKVDWIAGAHRGRSRRDVAVAESRNETTLRYAMFRDALRDVLPATKNRSGVVLTTANRRYFAAEVSTMLGYSGVPAHVVTDENLSQAYDLLRLMTPDVLVLLSDDFDESALPPSVELCLTVRNSPMLEFIPKMDLYLVDGIGFLGHSKAESNWVIYNDQYIYEISVEGRLVVTSLRNHTIPILRIETEDEVKLLDPYHIEIVQIGENKTE